MKEFQDLISELQNGVEDLAEHVNVPRSSMPPNILILRRQTVRQFPDGVMVALYKNDKLGLQFSIPYGGDLDSVVTPVALKEEQLDEISIPAANRAYNERQRRGEEALKKSDYKTATGHFTKAVKTVHLRAKKHATVDAGGVVREELQSNFPAEHEHWLAKREISRKEFRGNQLRAKKQSQQAKIKSGMAAAGSKRDYDDHYLEEGRIRQGKESGWWMADFEKHVVKANPQHAGKISWDDAQFHHNQGRTPEEAAKKYTSSHPTPFESHFHRESEELNEGVYVHKSNYRNTHGKNPSGRGSWAFGHKKDPKPEHIFWHHGTFSDAQKAAVTHAKQRGYGEIHVLTESSEQIEEAAEHGVIQRLRNIKDFHAIKHITHADGTKTHVDPTTAHALLTVHDALKPEHQAKFVQHLEHSKPKFHKMLDFAWSSVK